MTKKRIFMASLLTAFLVGGCSSVGRIVRQQEARSTEATLTAAGFQIEPADTADRLAALHAMPPFEVIAQKRGGKELFSYADPVKCHCQYVGDAQQYAEFQRLRRDESTAAARQEDPHFAEDASADLTWRDPWSDPWE